MNSNFSSPTVSNAKGDEQWTEGDAFSGVQSTYYWSSTSFAVGSPAAWDVSLGNGLVEGGSKTITSCVWPVRGGQ